MHEGSFFHTKNALMREMRERSSTAERTAKKMYGHKR